MRKIGFVVGRFQVPVLTEGHKHLLQSAMDNCDQLVAVVGVHPFKFTQRDPLTFEQVRDNVIDYANFVVKIDDDRDNQVWSFKLDSIIDTMRGNDDPLLFTGRDGFNLRYDGKYQDSVVVIDDYDCPSGTETRASISEWIDSVEDFNRGQVYGIMNQFPTAKVCVDGIILNRGETWRDSTVLLVKKRGEYFLRFPGGMVDPQDGSLEGAIRREVKEETGTDNEYHCKYLYSTHVNDWRADNILTAVFELTPLSHGGKTPIDPEIDTVVEVPFDEVWKVLVDEHKDIWQFYLRGLDLGQHTSSN